MCSAGVDIARRLWPLLLAVAAGGILRADEPEHPVIQLRNIYVPADQPADWPTAGEAYLPVDSDRLEQLLDVAQANGSAKPTPRVLEMQLYATLVDQQLVAGFGALRVARAEGPIEVLPLPASRLQIARATWRAQQQALRFGYWGQQRGLAIEVDRDDWFDFDWSASGGQRLATGQRLPS